MTTSTVDNTNLTLVTVIEAAEVARVHPGGSRAAWYRRMSRNAYTLDPHCPPLDDADLEKERLLETAKGLAALYIEQGPAKDDYGRASSVKYHCPELI